MLGGTKENSVSQLGVIDLPFRQINDFSQKGKRKKLSQWPDLFETLGEVGPDKMVGTAGPRHNVLTQVAPKGLYRPYKRVVASD